MKVFIVKIFIEDPIIDEHGIAAGTQTKAQVGAVDEHAHLAGEFAIAIG
jgi:hypothetical protein